ncbi:hypothetical protein, partial [Epilithonimonas vandammei]|uniref:hypothetical protein n=1 Tax=Epilithonimonas vandammei TaxID=2487072 RepID=UPI002899694B
QKSKTYFNLHTTFDTDPKFVRWMYIFNYRITAARLERSSFSFFAKKEKSGSGRRIKLPKY